MKTKQVLSLLLAGVMAVAMLSGCGAASSSAPASSAATASSTAASSSAPASSSTPAIPENEVTGDPSSKDAFVIWGWNTDFDNIKKVLEKNDKTMADRIVFVNAGGSDYYQDKIDEILQDPSNELYPDMMLLEVDYVKKYVNSDYLMDVKDLGITADDMKNMYNYNIQLGTDAGGSTRALFWQATPGSLQVRADLAEKYLGTTDAAQLQEKYFSSWDKIVAAAKTVNEASGGKVKLLSGYSDVIRIFLNSARKVGWYDNNDVIQVDDLMLQYMDLAKTLYTDGTTFNTTQWGTDWAAQKDGDGAATEAAIAYCGCPWYTYWCLTDTWKANTILVQGPAQFYWGGTGIAATKDCADKDMAGKLMKLITCDTDFMTQINAQNGDYVNNKEVISYLLKNNLGNSDKMFGDQNLIDFYSKSADNIDASTVTDVDQKTQSLFQTQVDAYAAGEKDKDAAIADFKASVHDLYSFLKVS